MHATNCLGAILIFGAASAALASAALLSGVPGPHAPAGPGFERPNWMSPSTTLAASAAVECYRREAAWHGKAYCASPVKDVLEVVWASCFAQERALLLAAADDAGDGSAMDYLESLEAQSASELARLVETTRSSFAGCASIRK